METIVLLHCSGSSGAQWRALAGRLGARYRVLAPDLMSCGSLAKEAAMIRRLLAGTGEPVHLVGHSYGGAVALHIAHTQPESLRSLTVIEPSAFHLLRDGDEIDAAALREIEEVATDAAAALAAGDYDGGFGRFADYWNGPGSWADLSPEKRAALALQLGKVVLDFQALFAEAAGLWEVGAVALPTLIVQGGCTALPSRCICARLRTALPCALFRVVQGAGHMLAVTHRDAVNALIVAQIDSTAVTIKEPTMQSMPQPESARYAKCVEISKRVRWDIDRDVIRGRAFEHTKKFLPDGLSKAKDVPFLSEKERLLLSQVQGRTYANIFGLVERYIGAKILEISRDHWLGDQTALEALVRFTDEELKHQELFRRIERMVGQGMPGGYSFMPRPNDVAGAVLGKCTWAVLALTCHIELFTQAHYRQSIEPDTEVSELWKDVFLFHWKEESQHAILDELEWRREDAKLAPAQRDQAVCDLIDLVAAVDGILQMQAAADIDYFLRICGRIFDKGQVQTLRETVLRAYRWQYIGSGVQDERFQKILGSMITEAQMQRIGAALAPIVS